MNCFFWGDGDSAARDNKATDEADQTVAIKKIILDNAKTGDLQWKRTLREIRLMRHFDNENVRACALVRVQASERELSVVVVCFITNASLLFCGHG
jgi:hypothetical protein